MYKEKIFRDLYNIISINVNQRFYVDFRKNAHKATDAIWILPCWSSGGLWANSCFLQIY